MKKSLVLVTFVVSATLLSGCSSNVEDYSLTRTSDGFGIEVKKSDSEISGYLTKENDAFYLNPADGKKVEVRSYVVNLESYINRHQILIGEYRSDIFYVSEVD